MLKSSKVFLISSEKKNKKGFRVRTNGIDTIQFKKNPTLLFMHKRPKGESKDEVLPLGYWDDVHLKDGNYYGTPVFDDTDPFAVSVYNKVENGTFRMASAGLEPGTWSDDGADLWLETSCMVEASIVDRGSNTDAMSMDVALYDEQHNLINLSDDNYTEFIKNHITMNKPALTEQSAKMLLLSDGATDADATAAIQKLVTLADERGAKIVTLNDTVKDLNEKLTAKDQEISKKDIQLKDEKIDTYLDQAIADGKIVKGQKAGFVTLADGNIDALKTVIDPLPKSQSVKDRLAGADNSKTKDKLVTLADKSYDELFASGELEYVKLNDGDAYKAIYREKFGKEPKNV